ncbi:hypothetical protein ABMA28_002303 [Loxostege sticticalis]|uniref:Rad21/Rec8-like protein N-terminal domain-containing protein n=1 Tax=Loxostege sticticalis TaxID=481309 RepID=A0ABD0T0T0_LOXSC
MFYPVESLKRGGRFYLCWVADSWPLRFATITHRQLWSQDIRRICDDLMEVVTNESGRPSNRFSLRLSSQLMRGLVRLYQRKVTIFLGDLCMINANVTKNVNKKWNIHEITVENVVHRPLPQLPPQALVIPEEPENEQRIEEIIQNSGNVVGNIQEITLRETALPEIQIPVNDGFGEENPEQALQMLRDQTLEMMLAQDASAAQHSALDLQLDTTGDKSHDKSRAPHDAPQMERISEHDMTLFRKSAGDERLTLGGLEKDIPEIPEIQLPDLSGPPPEKQIPEEPQMQSIPIPGPEQQQKEPEESISKEKEVVEIELEELEDQPQAKRRRFRHRLIIDKKTKLSADYLVTRIENPSVELRCEDSSDDIVQIRVPVETYFRRPAHAGACNEGRIGYPLTRLFQRNLGYHHRQAVDEREMEEVVAERSRRVRTRSALERIEEEAELAVPDKSTAQIDQPVPELEMTRECFNVAEAVNLLEPPNVTLPEDISDLPTQKLEILSQSQTRKRTSEYEVSPKRQRLIGYVSFRQSQQMAIETAPDVEADKENVPSFANVQPIPASQSPEKSLTVMLQEVGLADLPPPKPTEIEQVIVSRSTQEVRPRNGSESNETPLGSLDRTKVSLGDSDQTTDSRRFIRDQWGTEGTMVKILGSIKAGLAPLTVRRLTNKGPVLAGYHAIIAARCFTSILKLKQHGFIKVIKDPETLEIRDILLGPKFDQVK